jgi:hypothetical protein
VTITTNTNKNVSVYVGYQSSCGGTLISRNTGTLENKASK